jgi:bifunctional non-homologous end joining protein LigD
MLWARDPSLATAINRERRNPKYLSHVEIPERVRATGDLREALADRELVIVAVPSHGVRDVIRRAAPLVPRGGWDDLRAVAKSLADLLVREGEGRYLSVARRRDRSGRIYIDWLRNARGATAVAPFSPRARPEGTVAMPLGWDELERKGARPTFDIRTALARLRRLRPDPWEGYAAVRQAITPARGRVPRIESSRS